MNMLISPASIHSHLTTQVNAAQWYRYSQVGHITVIHMISLLLDYVIK